MCWLGVGTAEIAVDAQENMVLDVAIRAQVGHKDFGFREMHNLKDIGVTIPQGCIPLLSSLT